jgi:hypothetical protein
MDLQNACWRFVMGADGLERDLETASRGINLVYQAVIKMWRAGKTTGG